MKRYVIAGAGQRGLEMFGRRLSSDKFRDQAKLAGVFDINGVRVHEFAKECGDIPAFDNFNKMLAQTRPDAVIVATIDRYHYEYIIKAMEAGYDVISEKPMTIDAEKCRAILACR